MSTNKFEEFSDHELTQELRKRNNAVAVWCADDVLMQAKEDDVMLTHDEAVEIIGNIDNKHDASIGINWEVISTHIWMHRGDNPYPFQVGEEVAVTGYQGEANQAYRGAIGRVKEVKEVDLQELKYKEYVVEFPSLKDEIFDNDDLEPNDFDWEI